MRKLRLQALKIIMPPSALKGGGVGTQRVWMLCGSIWECPGLKDSMSTDRHSSNSFCSYSFRAKGTQSGLCGFGKTPVTNQVLS